MGTNPSLNRLAPGQPIGWGILGTGNIAQLFASDLACVPDARLVAMGSGSRETARVFGQKFGVPNQHGSYVELANDPRVQAVYIATPVLAHKENIQPRYGHRGFDKGAMRCPKLAKLANEENPNAWILRFFSEP
jgi:hypothetical protein